MDAEGTRKYSSQYIRDEEEDNLLRDIGHTRGPCVRWYHTLRNTKSLNLDSAVIDQLEVWPPCKSLGAAPHTGEMPDAV